MNVCQSICLYRTLLILGLQIIIEVKWVEENWDTPVLENSQVSFNSHDKVPFSKTEIIYS